MDLSSRVSALPVCPGAGNSPPRPGKTRHCPYPKYFPKKYLGQLLNDHIAISPRGDAGPCRLPQAIGLCTAHTQDRELFHEVVILLSSQSSLWLPALPPCTPRQDRPFRRRRLLGCRRRVGILYQQAPKNPERTHLPGVALYSLSLFVQLNQGGETRDFFLFAFGKNTKKTLAQGVFAPSGVGEKRRTVGGWMRREPTRPTLAMPAQPPPTPSSPNV